MKSTLKDDLSYYGDSQVNLLVDDRRSLSLKKTTTKLVSITLNEHQLCDLELLTTGAFSPLTGFMTRDCYESVLQGMRLPDGTFWPAPICLDLSEKTAALVSAGQSVAIRDPEGFPLAVMKVEDIWKADWQKEAELLSGNADAYHPTAAGQGDQGGGYYIGGPLQVLHLPVHYDYRRLRRTPQEVRELAAKLEWQRVIGFHTDNTLHRPEYEMALRLMRDYRANLLLLPAVGVRGVGDFDYYTRVRCCRHMIDRFPPESATLSLLPLSTRLPRVRNALLRCIINKNYGCTHIYINEQHAGCAWEERNFKTDLIQKYSAEIGISVIAESKFVYLPFEDEFCPEQETPARTEAIAITCLDIRNRIRSGKKIPNWATFPEIVKELRNAYPAPSKQGFAIFFTGLSGAGKSTIARVIYAKMLEIGKRPVTLLDGDIVRRNLSSELTFSKEHRDINVRRIGFVASEITKNRGIAICAPIAPYSATRAQIRADIEAFGGFVEVHVATPLDICEKRDRKGMYAKARAGLIKDYTGIDDPYEIPENPEVRIDTSAKTPNEAAQEILIHLGEKGFI